MQTTSIQGQAAATAEIAMANLQGLLGQAPAGKSYRVISMEPRELDGVWIAVATVEIIELDAEIKEDDDTKKSGEGDRTQGQSADQTDNRAELYYLSTHRSEAESAIPDVDGPVDNSEMDIAAPNMDARDNENDNSQKDDDPVLTGPETLTSDADDLSDKLRTDFNDAEATAYNVSSTALAADKIADNTLANMSEEEMRVLRAEIEQRLKEDPTPDLNLADESVTPAPAS